MTETKQYLQNPELSFIREDVKGNLLENNKFVNEDRVFGAGFSTVLQWMFTANPQRSQKKSDAFRPTVEHDDSIFHDGPDAICWLGHSTFILRINNKRLLTDPIAYDLPGVKRLIPFPFKTKDVINIDYILLSHSHRDHFDRRTFKEIVKRNPDVKVLCPLRMKPLIQREGARFVTEAAWYQEFKSDESGIRFVFLPAKHWNRRYMHDTNRELWGAFWIGSQQQSIYFAGDTAYHTHFSDARKFLPSIKYALLPIGAYKPSFMMKDSHTSPDEAAQAFRDLGAEKFIPMHFATYDLSDEPVSEPINTVHKLLSQGELLTSDFAAGRVYLL